MSGPPSIRRALAAWLLLPLALLVPLTAALFYSLALRPALDSLDHALDGSAVALEDLVRVQDGQPTLTLSPELDHVLRADRYDRVWWVALAPGGRPIGGDAALASLGGPPEAVAWRFADAVYAGAPVRMALHAWPCMPAAGPVGTAATLCEVRVAETLVKRTGMERDVLAAAALAMLVEAGVLSVLGWLAISRGLRPLEAISAEIGRRSPNHLVPVVQPTVPREVAPLVHALNDLFARVTAATQAEKAFLADAAHQLRTPLTALRTETELALLEPHAPAVEALLTRLHTGTTRAARLAHQLLAQARADHDAKNSPSERIDLKTVASEAVQDSVDRAVAAGVDLGFELQSAPVQGHGYLLRELLSNLVDNALLYTGQGARVTVRTRGGAPAVLEVEDNGPGIPPEERARIFERFQRGRSASGTGSGLGLSIVRDIVAVHGGSITLHDGADGAGLLVRVSLPAPGQGQGHHPGYGHSHSHSR